MEFTYSARDATGQLKTGTVEAVSQMGAYEMLQQHGLIVVKIAKTTKMGSIQQIRLFDRVSPKEVVMFSRQLATLINAKVPIVQALLILRNQVTSAKLKEVISEIAQKVESGESLSSAISSYPKVFSGLYVNLVRAGELSGTLDESLIYLSNQLEKDYDLRSKVIGAMTYPIFILCALLVVGFLMFLYVLPPLVAVLQESAVALPFTTKILITTTNFLQGYWWLVLIVLFGGGIGGKFYLQTDYGRLILDIVKIKAPIIGKLFKQIYMARFARNLSTLVAGGIPIVKALEAVADIVGNKVYKEIILDAAQQVRNGKSIASAVAGRTEFPIIVSQMIQVGETTGRLQEILDKLAGFYEREVEGVLKILTTLLEPVIMLMLGLAVAVMVAGILLPIYNLAGAA